MGRTDKEGDKTPDRCATRSDVGLAPSEWQPKGPASEALEGTDMQNLLTLGVLGFAAYRATQLVVHDSILDSWRGRVEMWHARKFDSKARTFFRDLIRCPYCSGWWLSMLTVLVYLTAAAQWGAAPLWIHAVEAWAVAGIQALLNRWDDSRDGAA